MKRSNHHRRLRTAVALALGSASIALLFAGACVPKSREEPAPEATQGQAPSFDQTTQTWDPAALVRATPGLLGWQSAEEGGGALVALSPDTTTTVIWSSAPGEGVASTALAVDPNRPRVLCAVSAVDGVTPVVPSLLLLGDDASVEQLPMPEGYEGIVGATFAADGRPLVAVYRATAETFETQLGTYTQDGAWQPATVEGDLPEFQFVERIAAVPGTDAIALVLKTPGGTGERDDEALVLARLEGLALTSYTPAFRDDALVGASPLRDAVGVVYPRTPGAGGLPDAVDLVRVEWSAGAWTETAVAEGLPIASGVETGLVAAQDPTGTYWVRTRDDGPHGTGSFLARFDPATGALTPTSLGLVGIDWFAWFEASGS